MLTHVMNRSVVRAACEKGVREEVAILTVRMRFFHLAVVIGLAELRLVLVRVVPEMQRSAVLMLAIRGRG